jgi:N6-L-threonylcarbamoyladenine synthase
MLNAGSRMLILGLETSCDETAVGIVTDDTDPTRRIRANAVATQLAEHQPYGGVVPEIAARAHLDKLDDLIKKALADARSTLKDLDGIAATCGPGLIGGVMVGAMTAKAIAAVSHLPFIAVNHLEAHALTGRLTHDVTFPYLLLLMSGGHCQLLLVKGVGNYRRLGTTIDDAVGECFDKSAKLLGLGYPGGPKIEQAAANGNPQAFDLPRPMLGRKGCDFSFAGLKTAVRTIVTKQKGNLTSDICFLSSDLAASLQAAIADILADRTQNAFELLDNDNIAPTALVAAGGVAANQAIRARLSTLAEQQHRPFVAPPVELCTDNGVMVAWAGLERLRLGLSDPLNTASRPRWPLEEARS